MGWADLVRDLGAMGLLDGSGKPPSIQSARKTWSKVKDDAAKAKTAPDHTPRSAPPSRQRSDWQPPLADIPRTVPALRYRREEPDQTLPPRREVTTPPSQGPPNEADPITIDDLSPEARAKIERLRRTLEGDGRKKFGHF